MSKYLITAIVSVLVILAVDSYLEWRDRRKEDARNDKG